MLLPLAGGEAFPVTALKEGVDTFRWAPDSRRLVVVSRDAREEPEKTDGEEPAAPPVVLTRLQHKRDGTGWLDLRRRHLYLVSLDAALAKPGGAVGHAKVLTSGPFDAANPAWSPDGRSIAFSSNRSKDPDDNNNEDIWILDVQSGGIRRLTTDEGSDDNPVWSPDGQSIAYVHEPQDPPIYATPRVLVVGAQGGAPRDVTGKLDRHVSGSPRWARDGKAIYVTIVDEGRTPVVKVTLDGVRTTVYDGDAGAFEIAGDQLVTIASTPTRPAEIHAVALAGGASRPLSRANDELFAKLRLEAAEEIHFKSADGTAVEGWIIKPPDFNFDKTLKPPPTYPLILRIHGGPVSQYTDSFNFEHQYLA